MGFLKQIQWETSRTIIILIFYIISSEHTLKYSKYFTYIQSIEVAEVIKSNIQCILYMHALYYSEKSNVVTFTQSSLGFFKIILAI